MSGACTVTPGYTFSTTGTGELITNPKLNLLGQPTVTIQPGAVTTTEISSVSGASITAGTVPLSALTSAAQSRVSGGIKNFIPNPQFNEWPNGTSIAMQSGGNYVSAGLWSYYNAGTITGTVSQNTVTPGQNDTILRDARYWYQFATTSTGSTQINLLQIWIPNARLFSGQSVTISFVAQVNSGTLPTVTVGFGQNFGTGGSPSSAIYTTASLNAQPTGTAAQVYATIAVPSVSGKTFGTNGDDGLELYIEVAQATSTFTVSITNVQLELGTIATTFENSLDRPTGQFWTNNFAAANGRITLTSGTPILSSSTTSTSIYFTPYNGNLITLPLLPTGSQNQSSVTIPFAETSLSLSGLSANAVYDLFGYYNAGILALAKVVWTNSTTRATALSYVNGFLVSSANNNYLYLGSFAINSTGGQCSWVPNGNESASWVGSGIWNQFNRISQTFSIESAVATWGAYSTTTWRQVNANTGWSIKTLIGQSQTISANFREYSQSGSNLWANAIGINSTTTPDSTCIGNSNSGLTQLIAIANPQIGVGLNNVNALEVYISGGSVSWEGYVGAGGINLPVTGLQVTTTY